MVVGILILNISIPESRSLKDKRRVVKSIKDRLRSGFNISIADIGNQDLWQSADLAIAVVSGDAAYANGVLSRVQDVVRDRPDAILTHCELEWR